MDDDKIKYMYSNLVELAKDKTGGNVNNLITFLMSGAEFNLEDKELEKTLSSLSIEDWEKTIIYCCFVASLSVSFSESAIDMNIFPYALGVKKYSDEFVNSDWSGKEILEKFRGSEDSRDYDENNIYRNYEFRGFCVNFFSEMVKNFDPKRIPFAKEGKAVNSNYFNTLFLENLSSKEKRIAKDILDYGVQKKDKPKNNVVMFPGTKKTSK